VKLPVLAFAFFVCAAAAPWATAQQVPAVRPPALRAAAAKGLSAAVTIYGLPGVQQRSCGGDDDGDDDPDRPSRWSGPCG